MEVVVEGEKILKEEHNDGSWTATLSTGYRDAMRSNQLDQAGSIKRARSSSRGQCNGRGRPTNQSLSRARKQPEQRDVKRLPVGPRDETNTEGQDSNMLSC
ncbi:hypothetical protein MRX96_035330 [Rhipicephalus microplus]